eukprot:11317823-Ditylum_brightwellii.AAC.1
MHVSSYIDKILDDHGWNTPCSDGKPIESFYPSAIKELETAVRPETLEEKTKLQEEKSLGYRTGLGELMYAYVNTRSNIRYSAIALSKFSSNPARCHYTAIRR